MTLSDKQDVVHLYKGCAFLYGDFEMPMERWGRLNPFRTDPVAATNSISSGLLSDFMVARLRRFIMAVVFFYRHPGMVISGEQ